MARSQAFDIVLASASPRRTALMTEWGIEHGVLASTVEEAHPPEIDTDILTERLALQKARDVAERIGRIDPSRPTFVLGADTLVSRDGLHLGKPRNVEDAVAMLLGSSGRELSVLTGVALVRAADGRFWVGHERSFVRMKPYSPAEALAYAAGGEPNDKAGAFAVQGDGARLVESVTGSYSNVVGLPRRLVFLLLDTALRDTGAPR